MIFAIDPGTTHSGWCLLDPETRQPARFAKTPNNELLAHARRAGRRWPDTTIDQVVIEMVASYGMAVGKDVFETCVWIGRFHEALHPFNPQLVYRRDVKLHHCHTARAKDSNITQALVDRFAPGATNHGKGTKAAPGWFYGFAKDIWQAYALGVYVADTTPTTSPAAGVRVAAGEVTLEGAPF